MTRKAIPLSVRYAVLCSQSDASKIAEIERAGGTLKLRYSKVLAIAKCRMSGESLIENGCEFDHKNCVEFGGTNDADNIQALTPKAHRRKTDADVARIAKAARQKRHHETGRSSGKKNWNKLKSRPFDRTFRKKFDGTVERKAE